MEYNFTSHAFDPQLPTLALWLGQSLARVLADLQVALMRALDAIVESEVHPLSRQCYPKVGELARFVPQLGVLTSYTWLGALSCAFDSQ